MTCGRQHLAEILADAGYLPMHRRGRWFAEDGDASNVNGSNLRLVRAVLCAGLYPNVVRIRQPAPIFVQHVHGALEVAAKAVALKMATREDGRVFLHPGSLNFNQSYFPSPWLVYFEKQVLSSPISPTTRVDPTQQTLLTPSSHKLHQSPELSKKIGPASPSSTDGKSCAVHPAS